uniref:Transmembrane protein 218 n=1 Tax=Eptatretus burgeri TaxID=7764 RepID=A0A8C4QXS5_EPTBU
MGAPKWMGIGIGIFILAALWVFSLFICILLAGAGRKMRLLSLGIFIFSSFISLLLIYFPKQDSTSLTPSSSMELTDKLFIWRWTLLSISLLCLLLICTFCVRVELTETTLAQPRRGF